MADNDKAKIDLTDPDCEPTAQDYRRLFQAVGDRVRAELAHIKPAPAQAEATRRPKTEPTPRSD